MSPKAFQPLQHKRNTSLRHKCAAEIPNHKNRIKDNTRKRQEKTQLPITTQLPIYPSKYQERGKGTSARSSPKAPSEKLRHPESPQKQKLQGTQSRSKETYKEDK